MDEELYGSGIGMLDESGRPGRGSPRSAASSAFLEAGGLTDDPLAVVSCTNVTVLGLGCVGRPLVVDLLAANFRVHGVDLDEHRLRELAEDPTLASALPDARLRLSTDKAAAVACADVVVVCVPTPWDHERAAPDLGRGPGGGTVHRRRPPSRHLGHPRVDDFPGTTEEVFGRALGQGSGLGIGRDLGLAYSPERVDPGNEQFGIGNTPCLQLLTALVKGGGSA